MKYIASVSWGKDSTAMLLFLMKYHAPLDEVVFYDTGMEFDAIYKTRDQILQKYLIPLGIKYTELHPKKPFIDLMIHYPHYSKKGTLKQGYGWCGSLCRWGTAQKLEALKKYCKGHHEYIGIAYDEPKRFERLRPNCSAPLYEWHITEEMALNICYENGIYFDKLYTFLKRVSCWCCRNKNLKEIQAYKEHLPEYYRKLCELEKLIGEPMKKPYYLEERFGRI